RAGLQVRNPGLTIAKVLALAFGLFLTVAICNHASVQGTPLGLPLAAVIIILFLVLLTYLAKRTTFGRHVYAVGGNAEAARRAGINVARVRMLVFMISSVMAGLGGVVLASRLQGVNVAQGSGTLLIDSISAA